MGPAAPVCCLNRRAFQTTQFESRDVDRLFGCLWTRVTKKGVARIPGDSVSSLHCVLFGGFGIRLDGLLIETPGNAVIGMPPVAKLSIKRAGAAV
jgi:hypothetical protein